MRVGILQNDQGCQCTTTLGECRGGYDLWRRMCMYQKMWFVETAGSEQTSSAIMLWAKTRVYVCSGRAGGNERHLLFYARYEATWHPHPTPPHAQTPKKFTSCHGRKGVVVQLHFSANLPLMFDQQSYTLLSNGRMSWSFLWNRAAPFHSTPSLPNTKPLPLQGRCCCSPNSGSSKQSSVGGIRPRPDRRKLMDVESSSSDQTLGHLIPPFLLENFSSYWTKGWGMDGFGMQYVSFNLKFAHICSLTALERYLPKKNLNPSPRQSDHHKTTSEESRCIYRLATLRSTKIHFAMLSFQSPWTFHWLHFQVTVSWSFLYALSLPTILTKHQAFAPSGPMLLLSKFRFFKAEFSLMPSAKAWQWKFVKLLKQGMRDDTQWHTKYGFWMALVCNMAICF